MAERGLGTRERRPGGFLTCLSTSEAQLKAGTGGGPSPSHAQALFQVFDTIHPFLFTQFSWHNFIILT